jgi:hypothetical protein
MTVTVLSTLVKLANDRLLSDKILEFINAEDYGAAPANSAAVNTTAINDAIQAATGNSGFVIVNPGVAFTEASIVLEDDVKLIVHDDTGAIIVLCADAGTTLPVVAGGFVVRSQGNTGVRMRAIDYGVSAEPILQLLDETSGDRAAVEPKFIEMEEITDPVAPAANRSRLYTRDNGAGKTQIVVRFPTGAVQVIATEP